LGIIFYNIFLLLFKAGIRIAALFDSKAKKWIQGRKGIFKNLETAIGSNKKIIWMHCASLGEFEQGRPLLEKLRSLYPDHKFLLTFFSPSGYEIKKDYKGADWVFYLPMDGPQNAKRFLRIVHPSLVVFVKYEFWYYYLKKIK
jgi:3-deoxy-D-manno-octulosonic-acid transferase